VLKRSRPGPISIYHLPKVTTAFDIIHAFEIIVEPTKRIPQSVRDGYHEIPLREIAGMDDKLIHNYFGVNLSSGSCIEPNGNVSRMGCFT